MAARLTKQLRWCKGLLASGLICIATSSSADEAAEHAALRACVEKATGLTAVTACEQRHQERLVERITSLRQRIRQQLPRQDRRQFDRNVEAWKQWLDSEKAMLDITLLGRSDGLGASLYPGALTQLYEERVRQLREHLHNLKLARD